MLAAAWYTASPPPAAPSSGPSAAAATPAGPVAMLSWMLLAFSTSEPPETMTPPPTAAPLLSASKPYARSGPPPMTASAPPPPPGALQLVIRTVSTVKLQFAQLSSTQPPKPPAGAAPSRSSSWLSVSVTPVSTTKTRDSPPALRLHSSVPPPAEAQALLPWMLSRRVPPAPSAACSSAPASVTGASSTIDVTVELASAFSKSCSVSTSMVVYIGTNGSGGDGGRGGGAHAPTTEYDSCMPASAQAAPGRPEELNTVTTPPCDSDTAASDASSAPIGPSVCAHDSAASTPGVDSTTSADTLPAGTETVGEKVTPPAPDGQAPDHSCTQRDEELEME